MKEEDQSDTRDASGAYVNWRTPTPHESRSDIETGRDTEDKDKV